MLSKEELKDKVFPLAAPLVAAQLGVTEEEVTQKMKDSTLPSSHQVKKSFEEVWQSFLTSLRPKGSQSSQYPQDSNEFSPEAAQGLLQAFQGPFNHGMMIQIYDSKTNHGNLVHLSYNIGQAFMFALLYCLGYGLKPLSVFQVANDRPPSLIFGDSTSHTTSCAYHYLRMRNFSTLSANNEDLNFEGAKFAILMDFLDLKGSIIDTSFGIRLIRVGGVSMKKIEACDLIYNKLKKSFHSSKVTTEGEINLELSMDNYQRSVNGIAGLIDLLCKGLEGSFARLSYISSTEVHTIEVHGPYNGKLDCFQVFESSKAIVSKNLGNHKGKLKAIRVPSRKILKILVLSS